MPLPDEVDLDDQAVSVSPAAVAPQPRNGPSGGPKIEPAPASPKPGNGACRVHITFKRSGNQQADIQRMRKARDVLLRYPGQDLFYFHLEKGPEQVSIEFPNDRIGFCPQLERELYGIVGRAAVQIERAAA
jgi:hypothetical protein